MKVSISLLSIKDNIINKVKELDKTDADYIHIDVMDGKFVPNKAFTFGEVKKFVKYISKKLDVHLMVNDPDKYIEAYALLNVDFITIHCEIDNVNNYIDKIKQYGLRGGLSINPETNIKEIFPNLDKIDLVLVMSVHPGRGGQLFMGSSINKIKTLKEEITKRHLNVQIEVDGGINDETAILCKEAGADILVSGSYITNDNNYQDKIDQLKNN